MKIQLLYVIYIMVLLHTVLSLLRTEFPSVGNLYFLKGDMLHTDTSA